jgi:hypothetical protein
MSKELLNSYGKGASMLMKMGYIPGSGLGENGRGIVEPIMPTLRKRGEGIKVDSTNDKREMMESRIVDDWSDYSSDNDDNYDNEKNKEISMPLGFEKSGTYKSEYDIPELIDIVRYIRDSDIDIPIDILTLVEEKKMDNLSIRKKFWDVFKNIKNDIPKLKYLEFEQKNIKNLNQDCIIALKVMNEVLNIIESDEFIISKILKIENIENIEKVNMEIQKNIICIISSKINLEWPDAVNNCDILNISEFGELLDSAADYLKFSKLFNTNPIIMKNEVNEFNDKTIVIEFAIFESIILKPLILKIQDFFNNQWTVENVNLGIGIYEELRDSNIFEDFIFEFLIIENIILNKIFKSIKEWDIYDQNKDINWVIEWLKILPMKYFNEIITEIINNYSKWIQSYEFEINKNDLENFGIYYWLDIANNEQFNKMIEKSIFKNLVKSLRKEFKFSINDLWTLVTNETILILKRFIDKIKEFELETYEDIIFNEIMIPYWISYLKLYENGDEYDEFLRQMTEIFSYLGFLNNNKQFKTIIKSFKECYEHNNFIHKRSIQSRRVLGDFTSIDSLLKRREDDWLKLIDKFDKKKINHDEDNIIFNNININSIKDIVFLECEKVGISIIPNGNLDGKQIYEINNGIKKFEVYFEGKIMYNKDGEPIGIYEIIN